MTSPARTSRSSPCPWCSCPLARRPPRSSTTSGNGSVTTDPDGIRGWSFFTRRRGHHGFPAGWGRSRFDPRGRTHDRRGIWWALVKHRSRTGWISPAWRSRLRAGESKPGSVQPRAPSREPAPEPRGRPTTTATSWFDIPDTERWHTTHDHPRFPRGAGGHGLRQLALIDWARQVPRDLDYFKVDVVASRSRDPTKGRGPLPSAHPRPQDFAHEARWPRTPPIDLENPDGTSTCSVLHGARPEELLAVGVDQYGSPAGTWRRSRASRWRTTACWS